ncbi:Ribose transport system permease protein RbsC [Novipirellula galeiformis]|uniref:Ribose transport system permease protein RbsC n=1 Tax=Novipirellula galeiformis TaxID=2528004 RepID=A0A5C6CEE6_9BACT|nr:ABC transporter permease [Novipirellula galeiformis]TWU21179.1 Ribose transport system permease protein RbsC [Novipirellula galeiformis]
MKQSKLKQSMVQYAGLLAVLILMVATFSLLSKNFFQPTTLISIANQVPDLTFLAVGMTLVLVVGGIDLSVGSLLALSSAVLGVLMVNMGWPLIAALPVAMLVAGACGLANGMITVGFRVPSFIVTLGMLEIARGATKAVTDSQSVYIGSSIEWFGQPIGGIRLSPAFLMAVIAVAIGQFVLTRTVFGRYCVAIGTNAEAVRMSGIRAAPYSIAVFGISGLMCGLAGLAQSSRLSTADPNAAIGIELAAIAACVIGGTSLMGGRGSVVSSFIGVLIIQVLQTGLAQIGVSDANKQIITGGVIVAAVLMDALRTRWRGGSEE